MDHLTRGFAWLALYVVLALAPLAVAALADPIARERPTQVELAAGLGFVAFALFALQFVLVARLRRASDPFGTDALMLLHKGMAFAAVAFAGVHALMLARSPFGWLLPLHGTLAERAGAAAVWCALVLGATSLWKRALRLSYETWRGIHRALAVALVAAMFVHAAAVQGYTRSTAVLATLAGYGVASLAVLMHARLARPLFLWRLPWRVVANRDEGAGTRTLALRPDGHRGLCFEPGQFVWLITGSTPLSSQDHPISIASSAQRPSEEGLELTIKALGDWSRQVVPALAPGTRVWVDGPFGSFTCDRHPGQGFALIAGGVGVTPMLSMLRTLCERGDLRPVVLFYAAHAPERAIFAAELARLEVEMPMVCVRVYEDPGPDWGGERGFVTAEILGRHLPADFRQWQFFVCGPPPMMDALEEVLRSMGVAAGRIQSERFDML